jgi:hypothetical protein
MKEIPLTKGLVTIVDDEDFQMLNAYKWYSVGHPKKEYAATYGGKGKGQPQHIRMHRMLLNAPDDSEVDHINGNRLDNRKSNLRLATRSQNGRNRGKFSNHKGKSHSSRFKGVTYHSRDSCWQATICVDGQYTHLGYHNTEREAALAYNKAAIKYHGEFAIINEI